jgi:hypothetical protein
MTTNRLPQAILAILAVFIGAVLLSTLTAGTVSDVGFFVYAAALVLLAVLVSTWLAGRLRGIRQ